MISKLYAFTVYSECHRFVLPWLCLLNRNFLYSMFYEVIEKCDLGREGQEDLVCFRMYCYWLWCVVELQLHKPMRGVNWRVFNSHCFLIHFQWANSVPLSSKYRSASWSCKTRYFHEIWLSLKTSLQPQQHTNYLEKDSWLHHHTEEN